MNDSRTKSDVKPDSASDGSGWFKLQKNSIEICKSCGAPAFAVFCAILSYLNNESKTCFPSVSRLTNDTGFCRRSIQRSISKLIEHGALKVKVRSGKSSVYTCAPQCAPTDGVPAHQDAQGGAPRCAGDAHEGAREVRTTVRPNKKKELEERTRRSNKTLIWPPELDSDDCRTAWSEWISYRDGIKKPLKQISQQKQIDQWAKKGPSAFMAAIEYSIGQGWTGIHAENGIINKGNRSNGNGMQESLNGDLYRELTGNTSDQLGSGDSRGIR